MCPAGLCGSAGDMGLAVLAGGREEGHEDCFLVTDTILRTCHILALITVISCQMATLVPALAPRVRASCPVPVSVQVLDALRVAMSRSPPCHLSPAQRHLWGHVPHGPRLCNEVRACMCARLPPTPNDSVVRAAGWAAKPHPAWGRIWPWCCIPGRVPRPGDALVPAAAPLIKGSPDRGSRPFGLRVGALVCQQCGCSRWTDRHGSTPAQPSI